MCKNSAKESQDTDTINPVGKVEKILEAHNKWLVSPELGKFINRILCPET